MTSAATPPTAEKAAPPATPPTARAPRSARRRDGLLGGAYAVFERDFLAATSRGGFVGLRTLVVVLVSAAAMLIVGVSAVQDLPIDGKVVFLTTAIGTLGFCALIGPAIAADAIAGERAAETLLLVLAAPVTPLGLVLAKFAARIGALLVPFVGALPVVALSLVYGGVPQTWIWGYLGMLLLVAVWSVSMSLLTSAHAATVARAALAAYVIAILLPGAELLVIGWIGFEILELDDKVVTPFMDHNPYWAIGKGFATRSWSEAWQAVVAVAVLSATGLVLATRRVAAEFAVTARGKRVRRVRPLRFEDPVLHRAAPKWIAIPDGWGSAFAVVLVAVCCWLPAIGSRFNLFAISGGLVASTWLAGLFVLIRASQAFAADRPKATLALVLASPVGRERMWWGHFLGLMSHGARMLVPAFALAVVAVVDTRIRLDGFVGWIVSTAALLVVLASFGLWHSARAPTGGKAVLRTLVWFLGLMIVWGGVLVAVLWMLRVFHMRSSVDEVGSFLGCLSPPGWQAVLTIRYEDLREWRSEEKIAFATSLWACPFTLLLAVPMREGALRSLAEDAG